MTEKSITYQDKIPLLLCYAIILYQQRHGEPMKKRMEKEKVAGIEDFSLKLIENYRGCFRGIAPMTITRILCKLPQVLINLNSTSIIII